MAELYRNYKFDLSMQRQIQKHNGTYYSVDKGDSSKELIILWTRGIAVRNLLFCGQGG
jgi:hypothetical protein